MHDPIDIALQRVTIAIPSRSRAGQLLPALDALHPRLLNVAMLVVPFGQASTYQRGYPNIRVVGTPEPIDGIAATRQWLTETCNTPYLLQISDDMKFAVRDRNLGLTPSGAQRLRPATDDDVLGMVLEMVASADEGYAHVGVSQRAGNNRHSGAYKEPGGRMCDVYLHDVRVLRMLGIRWDRLPVMEDFDVTLQLLRHGYPSLALYQYTWDQAASNAPGGCSDYRTLDVQAQGARGLARHHPDFVTVVEKESTHWAGGMGKRLDVRVQWAKALKAHDLKGTTNHE